MNWKIPLSDINFTQEESSAVQDVLHREWLTMGAVTQEFESAFKAYTGARHALAVTNCTAALHMACIALGIGPGDEVILPSLTFVASANAVRYTGAAPVFAEITSMTDLNISPRAIQALITDRTRAIMVVHYGGYPCDMPQVMDIARGNDLFVIEDAAHAVGSEINSRHMGTWGDIGCFSFFSNKNMTTGEGGMVVTNQDDLAEKLRLMRSHGMTSLTWDRHRGHSWSYDVVALGYNYRIDEIRSSLGKVQLAKIDSYNHRRRFLTQLYYDRLQAYAPQITIPFTDHPGQSSAHIMPVLLPEGSDRVLFMEYMKSQGIQTSIHYPPIHIFTAYQGDLAPGNNALPLTEGVAFREVTLPLFPMLTDADVDTVARDVGDALENQ